MVVQSVYERPTIIGDSIVPGIPFLPQGFERHVIPGGGSRGIKIDKGDQITVIDQEGLQTAEMAFFTPDGGSDAGMLGAKGFGRAENIINTLSTGGPSGKKVLNALDKSFFDLISPQIIFIFFLLLSILLTFPL